MVGASDLNVLDQNGALGEPSRLHRSMDPQLLRAMGKAIDLKTGQVRESMPDVYRSEEFLTMRSIINTLLSTWNVPREDWLGVDTANSSKKASPIEAILS